MAEREGYKTSVWWHIDSCPIPEGYDHLKVRQAIQSVVTDGEVGKPSDRVTITAFGTLKDIRGGDDVLRGLSSTGISLTYTPNFLSFVEAILSWTENNRPPCTVMLIVGPGELEALGSTVYDLLKKGFYMLVGYSERPEDLEWLWKSFLAGVAANWPWETILKGKMAESSETVEPSTLICAVCDEVIAYQSIEDFIKHFKCDKTHAYLEMPSPPRKNGSTQSEPKSNPGFVTVSEFELEDMMKGIKRKADDEVEDE